MKKPHILIVDDEQDIRMTLEASLQAEGYETTQAASGKDALRLTQEILPDLVLLDIMMPDIDGHEICRRIKGDDKTRHIAVVFASVLRATRDKVEGLDIGADDYITKPFKMPELLAKLRALFRVQEYQRHLELLVDFAHSVNELDPDDISKAIISKLEGIISADRYSVFILDDETGLLKALAHNHNENEMDGISLPASDSPIMRKALNTGEKVFTKNFESSGYDDDIKRKKYTDGFALCLPLKVGREVFGVLNINGNSTGFFNNLDYSLPELAAELMSASLNNARRLEQMEKLAITDGLTGLYNRRYFYELFEKEFERSKRFHQPLSVIMVDIDYFKKINDTYGHLAGDIVLENLAKRLTKHVRMIDTVARYGGEEFVILLPQSNSKDSLIVAERIREDVSATEVETEDGALKITVSLGISDTSKGDLAKPQDLFNRADEALYQAKRDGRNRTIVYTAD